ncbi:roadblock/LC7 domain-containing protein [Corynebacterium sp. CCUG 71335]|uniref:roadblock/LC7 domain-containing protein n=1 Tax=Corynebacterium sp. CCUG 71335 TaxID=2823892 RepID=UPI00210A59CF|nr:roadblock/LC7 domain-containing protein [Corynebacterium sp. CCUG 71335]
MTFTQQYAPYPLTSDANSMSEPNPYLNNRRFPGDNNVVNPDANFYRNVDANARIADADIVDAEIADDDTAGVDEWSTQIGRHRRVRGTDFSTSDLAKACLPIMSNLRNEVPGVHSVVLGTGDGLHVCSIGLKDGIDASRITALNSSMFGVAAAHAKVIDPVLGDEHSTSVIVELPGDNLMALVRIEHEPIGHLVMGIFATDTQLGMLTHHARSFGKRLGEWLREI